MSNTKNIFEFLSDEESGDEGRQQNKEKRVRTRGKKPAAPAQQQQEIPDRSRKVVDNKHKKEYRKNTGPSARNRSKDRQSGTGISGVQRGNYRKGGAGQGNLGTVKDELVGRSNNREEVEEESEEEEEQEDNRMTVEQYFAQKGSNLDAQIQGQQAEQKKKTFDKKELAKDKLEVYEAKPAKQVAYKSRQAEQSNYKPGYNGEGADLLSFRTGFVVDPKRKKRAPQQQQEGEAPAEQAKEGEAPAEQAKEGEQKEQRQKDNRGPRNNNNRNNNNRGPRNNNNRGGDRKENRGPRGGKGFQTENTEDFPTLG